MMDEKETEDILNAYLATEDEYDNCRKYSGLLEED